MNTPDGINQNIKSQNNTQTASASAPVAAPIQQANRNPVSASSPIAKVAPTPSPVTTPVSSTAMPLSKPVSAAPIISKPAPVAAKPAAKPAAKKAVKKIVKKAAPVAAKPAAKPVVKKAAVPVKKKPAAKKAAAPAKKAVAKTAPIIKQIKPVQAALSSKPAQQQNVFGTKSPFNMPAVDVKGLFTSFMGKQNIDSVIQSGNMLSKGFEEIGKLLMNNAKVQLEESLKTGQQMMSCKNLSDLEKLQKTYINSTIKRAVDQSRELSKISGDVSAKTTVPLNEQFAALLKNMSNIGKK